MQVGQTIEHQGKNQRERFYKASLLSTSKVLIAHTTDIAVVGWMYCKNTHYYVNSWLMEVAHVIKAKVTTQF